MRVCFLLSSYSISSLNNTHAIRFMHCGVSLANKLMYQWILETSHTHIGILQLFIIKTALFQSKKNVEITSRTCLFDWTIDWYLTYSTLRIIFSILIRNDFDTERNQNGGTK